MRRESIDVFYVDSRHEEIHQRLMNWANWVRVRPHYAMSPMFRAMGYKSNSRQWHAPEPRIEVDVNDAWLVEKSVCKLPERHRVALVWWYVTKWPAPWKMRQRLGCTEDGLLQLCNTARAMVDNGLRRGTIAIAYTHRHQSRREAGVSLE